MSKKTQTIITYEVTFEGDIEEIGCKELIQKLSNITKKYLEDKGKSIDMDIFSVKYHKEIII